MNNLVLFLLSTIGLTHIIVDGKIFQFVRDFFDKTLPEYISSAIHCYQCSGFWSGLICSFIFFDFNIFFNLACGWAGSFLGNYSAMYMNYIQANSMINTDE